MSDTLVLSEAHYRLLKQAVKAQFRHYNESREAFRKRALAACLSAMAVTTAKREAIEGEFDALFERHHRETANSFFEQQNLALEGNRKRAATSATGPRVKNKDEGERNVSLANVPMSPPRASTPAWNPTEPSPSTTQTVPLYSGTLNFSFQALFPPPSPTRIDSPGVISNPVVIAPPTGGIKRVARQTLDPDRLKNWKAADRRGFIGQNEVMNKVSAETAALCALQETQVHKAPATNFGNSAWEWLHLVSFKMGGIDNTPQQSANLVAGTYECNSQMISIEEAIKDFVLIDGLTLGLEVTATCIEGTHVGKSIDYKVLYTPTGKTEIAFTQTFDPLSHVNPFSGDKAVFDKAMRRHFGLPAKIY